MMKARKKGEQAFPSTDIESLKEIAIRAVAKNIELYPQLTGVKDKTVLEAIIR